ncbi:hypothetical protein Syun_012693 [Stephania yunnanensis]|uniref:Pentatricopeptide repeat-containing protein n=1 Tax=Stephania yunnanensis TaxID=152371 RepID=A0AAP0JZV8_9MAGN
MGTPQTLLLISHSCSFNLSNSLSKSQKKNKRKKHKRHPLQLPTHPHHHQHPQISYPKSSPTPLLTPRTHYTQTKRQALHSLLQSLQSSISNGLRIDPEIFSSLLETCFQIQAFDCFPTIHSLIPPFLLRNNFGLSSKLLRLYAFSGDIDNAHQLFDEMPQRTQSAFPWNSLISGYAELGRFEEALALYFQMEEECVEPDEYTFPRVLKACAGIGSVRVGEGVHRDLVRAGFGSDGFVLNALVDMYAKCGDIVKARMIFDKIGVRDGVSWNSMIAGYVQHGLLVEALEMLRGMIRDGFDPDAIAVSTVLSGLSSFSSRIKFEIHGWVLRRGQEWNLSIANALILVYSERRKLNCSRWLFDGMPERDVVSWNSIISAHQKNPRALVYFRLMEESGTRPDSITFVALLSSCAHLRLVEDGWRLFVKMKEKYRIKPGMEHYACMVNVLGRAGLISEAYEFILKMGFEAGPTVWGALLYACSLHGDDKIGEIAANQLFELEPDNEHNYELLIKIYGVVGRWEKVEEVMRSMEARGLDS